MSEYNFYVNGLTEKGNRKLNQDNFSFFNNEYKFLIVIVADGMGGHEGGEVASKIACDTINEYFKNIDLGILKEKKIKEHFLASVKLTLQKMKDISKDKKTLIDMGTTLNINLFIDNQIYILNIGDSRTSSITKKFVNYITIDQNLATLAKYYEKYNNLENAQSILISSLGPNKDLKIDLYKAKLNNSGYIMISTDGVHNYISEDQLLKVLNSTGAKIQEKAKEIIQIAYQNGSNDNMTCVLVKYERK